MTRETKIGLLVGLAFIIVVGILLADYSAKGSRPPQAAMAGGQPARDSYRTLGSGSGGGPALAPLIGQTVQQTQPLNLQAEAAERARVRIPDPGGRPLDVDAIDRRRLEQPQDDSRNERIIPPPGTESRRVETPESAIREHKAEAGDTVSRMARRYLGSDSRTNLDAIIRLNPSLMAPPHRVDIGKVYKIPAATTPSARETTPPPAEPILTPPAPPTPPSEATVTYTTRPGDSLWKIAVTQCGSGSNATVARIRELNKDVLKGDIIQPNVTLKLPARQVASR